MSHLERNQTLRQELLSHLETSDLTLSALSKLTRRSEKELVDHLDNLIQHKSLEVLAAQCQQCGFEFSGRLKAKKPGKCPECKSSHIDPPVFSVLPDNS